MSNSGAIIEAADWHKGDLIYPALLVCHWSNSLMCSSDFTTLPGVLWGGIAFGCGKCAVGLLKKCIRMLRLLCRRPGLCGLAPL